MAVTSDVALDPLAVPLDGSLLKTNLLGECALVLVRERARNAFRLLAWMLRGRAVLARELANRAPLDPALLPYDRALVAHLREERERGRRVLLVAPGAPRISRAIAAHLGVFDEVVDEARPRASLAELRRDARPSWLRVLPHALRSHQWAKNVLVLVPLVAAHRIDDPRLVLRALAAFAAFSACASSAYVINDLLDLPSDRRHASKARRPFAAGDLSIGTGLAISLGCIAFAAAVSALLPSKFAWTLALYWVSTMGYSLFLKKRLLVDVHVLAILYALRVFAGSAATGVSPSPWLLAFSTFLFLSLALLKRFSEVAALRRANGEAAPGRAYAAQDVEALSSVGAASGFAAVVVLVLYVNASDVTTLYERPKTLWLLCPLLLYWLSRIWLLAHRGHVDADPVLYALRDRVSRFVAVCAAIVLVAATFGWQL